MAAEVWLKSPLSLPRGDPHLFSDPNLIEVVKSCMKIKLFQPIISQYWWISSVFGSKSSSSSRIWCWLYELIESLQYLKTECFFTFNIYRFNIIIQYLSKNKKRNFFLKRNENSLGQWITDEFVSNDLNVQVREKGCLQTCALRSK